MVLSVVAGSAVLAGAAEVHLASPSVISGQAIPVRGRGGRTQPRHRGDDARYSRARAALQAAELRTGVKSWGSELPRLRALPSAPEPAVAEQAAAPKSATPEPVAPESAAPEPSRAQSVTSERLPDADLCPDFGWCTSGGEAGLPVQAALRRLIPGGVLAPGSVCSVQGSMSLLFGLLAEASQASAWIAVVGAETVGILAAAKAGVSLERLALVPQPGQDAACVVAALLDGMDAVVIGPDTALSALDRRRLTARARERGAVIISALPWEGAAVSLTATGGSWQGADAGAGWLTKHSLLVQRTGRGAAARPRPFELSVPLAYRPANEAHGPNQEQYRPAPLAGEEPAALCLTPGVADCVIEPVLLRLAS